MPLSGFPRCWRFSPVMLCATLFCRLAQADETLRVGIYHNPLKLMLDENQAPSGILGELQRSLERQELLLYYQLKVDRSFNSGVVHSPADAAIVETTLALAENPGLAVIVEGVEIDAQFEWVRARGCTGFQDFLFGRPVLEEELDLP